jgi:hypothetical protein
VEVNGVRIGDGETTMNHGSKYRTQNGEWKTIENRRLMGKKSEKDHRATWLDCGGSLSKMATILGKGKGGSLETAASVIALKQASSFL